MIQLLSLRLGLDFVIDTSDGMENIGPIFAFCRYTVGNNKIAIPIPDFTFTGWPEVGQVSYWYATRTFSGQ